MTSREHLSGRARHVFQEVLMGLHLPSEREKLTQQQQQQQQQQRAQSRDSRRNAGRSRDGTESLMPGGADSQHNSSSNLAALAAQQQQNGSNSAYSSSSDTNANEDNNNGRKSDNDDNNNNGQQGEQAGLGGLLPPSGLPPTAGIARWRLSERQRTVAVALVCCLNIGVEPPDTVKTEKSARLLCWVDPLVPQRPLEAIGKALQAQYERWQPRARYKLSLDPTVDDVKKLCVSLRRSSKSERILFHYNGHGVPRPTNNGEIWVFNKNFTQYIPLSLYELQAWLGGPSICVFDCSFAGLISNWYIQFARQREREAQRLAAQQSATGAAGAKVPSSIREFILLAACGPTDVLPMDPRLPADVFTSCLTTPIKMALRWFCLRSPFVAEMPASMFKETLGSDRVSPLLDMVEKIPGRLNDRRTPLGELNWIFTAITDTIAWNTLPRDVFQKLFRQDLLVASLFRNFLLAERIMKQLHCTPRTWPALPATHAHPMWAAWDASVDWVLRQLPGLLKPTESVSYDFCPFFAEQLTAFEVWLSDSTATVQVAHESANELLRQRLLRNSDFVQNLFSNGELGPDGTYARSDISRLSSAETPPLVSPPEQLPIVLQVLLSQAHRLRALILLARFLDLGPWAVNLALNVGIFPYVLKLLQSPSVELRPVLSFVWCKILALDSSCQVDLIKDNGHSYFITVLNSGAQSALSMSNSLNSRFNFAPASAAALFQSNLSTPLRVMSVMVLASLCNNFRPGRLACFHNGHLLTLVLQTLRDTPLVNAYGRLAAPLYDEACTLRKWCMLYLARFWDSFPDAQLAAAKQGALDILCPIVKRDPHIEIRASAAYALGCFFSHQPTPGVFGTFIPFAKSEGATSASDGSGTDSETASPQQTQQVLGMGRQAPQRGAARPTSQDMKQHQHRVETEFNIAVHLFTCMSDPSPVVRREILFALTRFLRCYQELFAKVVSIDAEAETKVSDPSSRSSSGGMDVPSHSSSENSQWLTQVQAHVRLMWQIMKGLVNDPHPSVAIIARAMVAPAAAAAAAIFLRATALSAKEARAAAESPVKPPPRMISKSRSSLGIRSLFSSSGERSQPVPTSDTEMASETDSLRNFPSVLEIGSSDPRALVDEALLTETCAAPERSTWFEWCCYSWQEPILPSESVVDADIQVVAPPFCQFCSSSEASGRSIGVESDPANPVFRQICERSSRISFFDEVSATRYLRAWAPQEGHDFTRGPDPETSFEIPERFSEQVGIVDNAPFGVRRLISHSYDGVLAVTDSQTPTVRFYDMESCRRLSELSLASEIKPQTPARSQLHRSMGVRSGGVHRIDDLLFVNSQSMRPLLLTVGDDANVRLHAHSYARADGGSTGVASVDATSYALDRSSVTGSKPSTSGAGKLLTAFSAFDDAEVSESLPFCAKWQQGRGALYVAGNSSVIRRFDLEREQRLADIDTGSASNATVMAIHDDVGFSPAHAGGIYSFGGAPWGAWQNVLMAGFGDGTVRLFDVRMQAHDSRPVAAAQHGEWIVSVAMPRGVPHRLLTASVNGEVRIWDPRKLLGQVSDLLGEPATLPCLENIKVTNQPRNLAAIAAHDFTPMFAAGFRKQKVVVYDYTKSAATTRGDPIRYHDGFLGLRIGQVAALHFDSVLDVLVVGASDSIVSLYTRPGSGQTVGQTDSAPYR